MHAIETCRVTVRLCLFLPQVQSDEPGTQQRHDRCAKEPSWSELAAHASIRSGSLRISGKPQDIGETNGSQSSQQEDQSNRRETIMQPQSAVRLAPDTVRA